VTPPEDQEDHTQGPDAEAALLRDRYPGQAAGSPGLALPPRDRLPDALNSPHPRSFRAPRYTEIGRRFRFSSFCRWKGADRRVVVVTPTIL